MQKETTEKIAPTHDDRNLDNALQAVYAQYGSDLERFFRDAHNEAMRNALELKKFTHADLEIQR